MGCGNNPRLELSRRLVADHAAYVRLRRIVPLEALQTPDSRHPRIFTLFGPVRNAPNLPIGTGRIGA
jgi:hypothetical protein